MASFCPANYEPEVLIGLVSAEAVAESGGVDDVHTAAGWNLAGTDSGLAAFQGKSPGRGLACTAAGFAADSVGLLSARGDGWRVPPRAAF